MSVLAKPVRAGLLGLVAGITALWTGLAPVAAEGVVNIYSSRHYDTDERLYSEFTEQTGIQVRRIDARADVLLERIRNEGRNSPADLLLTTDAGRLWAAEQAGVLAPVESAYLNERVPADLRHPEGLWYGFSTRARVIFYDKASVDPSGLTTYADLTDPRYRGLVCTRSSSNIYMTSLMAALIHHQGSDGARDWAQGVWENRARAPQGGDTDQLRGIVSGECAIAVANTYYYARAFRLDVRGLSHPDQTGQIGVIFPNQDTTGTHVNVSGGGLLTHAPNRENGIRFLEYLASDSAQAYFAAGNDEYPVVDGASLSSTVEALGDFKRDTVNLRILGENQAEAQRLFDEVGYR